MSYCTVQEIRDSNKKLEPVTEATDPVIESRITESEKRIKVDLSSMFTASELDSISSDSPVLNLMCIYKAVELTLVNYYGASRKTDEISDIQYYEKQYKYLLNGVKDGTITIESSTVSSPNAYPKRTQEGTNLRLYPRKGVSGFIPDGQEDSYVDDGTLE